MKVVIEVKDGDGDIRVLTDGTTFKVEIEMEDVGGMFWEPAGVFEELQDAMICVAETIKSNIETGFYERGDRS